MRGLRKMALRTMVLRMRGGVDGLMLDSAFCPKTKN